MNLSFELEKIALASFKKTGLTDSPVILQVAKNIQFGDYQINGVMGAAKKKGLNPRELAQRVIDNIDSSEMIEEVEIAGPGFINIRLSGQFLTKKVYENLSNETLKISKIYQNKKIVIDYSSPNLAKEMHVGHLRSTIIGDSIHRVFHFLGANVIAQNHVGDWGTQFGMLVAYLIEKEDEDLKNYELVDLESFYREAKLRFDQDEKFAELSRNCVVKLQQKDEKIMTYWKKFVEISLSHANHIYKRLNVLLTEKNVVGESAYNNQLQSIVDSLMEKGLAVNNQGAKLIYLDDVKDKNNQSFAYIIQKQDGGFLYSTTDFAALKDNIEKFQVDQLIYVVDARQSLHFQALFKISKEAGWLPDEVKATHIAFGTMMGEDGKPFKTRTGGTVKLIDLLDEAEKRAYQLIKDKNPDFSEEALNKIASTVAIGAIKYADLSKNRTSDYIFNWDNMLSFEGNTAPYLQYAYTRIQSIMKKIDESSLKDKESLYQYLEPVEKQLAVLLLQFEEVLSYVAQSYQPHYLANYLYQVATVFSRFYEECTIIQAEENVKIVRVRLSLLTQKVLKQGLYLLGIDVLEVM